MSEGRLARTRAAYDAPPDATAAWLEFLEKLHGPMVDEIVPVTGDDGVTRPVRIPRPFTVWK